MKELVLVRHGETAGDSAIRLYGATDIELSELGRRQMACAAECLRDEAFDTVIVSPLRRSVESAAIIVEGGGPERTVVEAFAEINFGRWEGWTFEEAAARDPENHSAWSRGDQEFRFPGGETRVEFHRRVEEATRRVLSERPGKSLAVLHKGVIKVIFATLLGIPFERYRRLPVDLGSIHRLKRKGDKWTLAQANLVSHLGSDWIPDGNAADQRPAPPQGP